MARISSRSTTPIPAISFTTQVWKEGSAYVAYAQELDVSSCGDSLAQARARLKEAVALFLEECSRKGILDTILTEAGFEKRARNYRPRRILARARVKLAVPLAS